MNKKQELIDFVIGNEFITKPSLQEKFTELLNEAIIEQLRLHVVSQRSELLIAYEKNHYTPQEWALASKQCVEDIDSFLAINCG